MPSKSAFYAAFGKSLSFFRVFLEKAVHFLYTEKSDLKSFYEQMDVEIGMRKLALSDEILLSIEKPARYIGGEVNSRKGKDPFCHVLPGRL